jgi:hypothetical protein
MNASELTQRRRIYTIARSRQCTPILKRDLPTYEYINESIEVSRAEGKCEITCDENISTRSTTQKTVAVQAAPTGATDTS